MKRERNVVGRTLEVDQEDKYLNTSSINTALKRIFAKLIDL